MKILIYCQHVLGIGHLFRTLEIARAMQEHQVTLILGGPPVSINMPEHVRILQLPGLQMDAAFSGLFPVNGGLLLEDVKTERITMLYRYVEEVRPDILMVELFPFGRNGFSFELMPLLKSIRCGKLPKCKVVCSLRDILVEKSDQDKFERRVLDRLNSLFDALLVHGDPDVIPLDTTFSRVDDITIPLIYTGYICERSGPADGLAVREKLRLMDEEQLIVVSAGGGNVGHRLLKTALRAYDLLEFPVRMQIFTGPYFDGSDFANLRASSVPGVRIERFADNFPAWLVAADLSISMGGYNTTINVVAAGTPAILLPFSQNREQRMRAERLASITNICVLDEETLSPAALAEQITTMIQRKKQLPDILLDGAAETNNILTGWIASGKIT